MHTCYFVVRARYVSLCILQLVCIHTCYLVVRARYVSLCICNLSIYRFATWLYVLAKCLHIFVTCLYTYLILGCMCSLRVSVYLQLVCI